MSVDAGDKLAGENGARWEGKGADERHIYMLRG